MKNNNIYPCLWFESNAREAADFYCSIFSDGNIIEENPMVVIFKINGTRFMGLNGSPKFHHSPAISFVVECETQQEIDHYWEKLGENGRYDRCGWLTDKYGVSWQIIPAILSKLMTDPEKSQKVMEAFMQMQKFDIDTLLNV